MLDNTSKLYRSIGAARRHALEGTPLASFQRRFIAFAIDMFLVVLLLALASIPMVVSKGEKSGDYHFTLNPFHGWALLSLPLYFGLGTWMGRGRTIGKRLMRIRVVSLAGEHLSLWLCVQRALGYASSVLQGGLGFLKYFTHPNRQTLHDLLAETIVVSDTTPPVMTHSPTPRSGMVAGRPGA